MEYTKKDFAKTSKLETYLIIFIGLLSFVLVLGILS